MKVCRFFPDAECSRSSCDSLLSETSFADNRLSPSSSYSLVHRITADSSNDLIGGDVRHVVQSLAEHVIHSSSLILGHSKNKKCLPRNFLQDPGILL